MTALSLSQFAVPFSHFAVPFSRFAVSFTQSAVSMGEGEVTKKDDGTNPSAGVAATGAGISHIVIVMANQSLNCILKEKRLILWVVTLEKSGVKAKTRRVKPWFLSLSKGGLGIKRG